MGVRIRAVAGVAAGVFSAVAEAALLIVAGAAGQGLGGPVGQAGH